MEKSIGSITGYAAKFDIETNIADVFRETIRRGAFRAAIGRDDVRALFNHDSNFVLGRTRAGTLRLREDGSGLHYEIDPPSAQWATDLRESIKRGDISQSSFAFRVIEERWSPDRVPLREIFEAELFDVSPVTYAAYPTTTASARGGDAIELAGAATEGRSAIVESVHAVRRLRLLAAAPSTCERCRYRTAVRLVGTREARQMRFSGVCVACSERGLLIAPTMRRTPTRSIRRSGTFVPPKVRRTSSIILLDDVGFGASSAFGGPCQTPVAERLASNGLKYTRFHTTRALFTDAAGAPDRPKPSLGRAWAASPRLRRARLGTARCCPTRSRRWPERSS